MNLISALFAISLVAAPAPAPGCPPLGPVEKVRAAVEAATPGSDAPAIDVSAFKVACPAHATALICTGGAGGKLTLREVRAIDWTLRQQFTYRSDFIQFGRWDVWRSDVVCGDCEDYALTLATRLHAAGQAGDTMRIMIWKPSKTVAHATLLIETADAGVVEAGVGNADTESPDPYRPERGERFATIRLDGKRKLAPLPGYVISSQNTVVRSSGN